MLPEEVYGTIKGIIIGLDDNLEPNANDYNKSRSQSPETFTLPVSLSVWENVMGHLVEHVVCLVILNF